MVSEGKGGVALAAKLPEQKRGADTAPGRHPRLQKLQNRVGEPILPAQGGEAQLRDSPGGAI